MTTPERGAAVEEGEGSVGIARHIVHGKVADHEGIHQNAGGHQQTERTHALRILKPAQFGIFTLPELRRADGGSRQRAEQGDEKTDIGGKIHEHS